MTKLVLLLASLLVASDASAKCAWIPLCFPAYDPPISAMRVYVDGKLAGEKRPMWNASGHVRTNFWGCADPNSTVEITMVGHPKDSNGVPSVAEIETDKSTFMLADPNRPLADCAIGGTPIGRKAKMSDFKGPEDYLLGIGKTCFDSATCGQLLMQKCQGDPTCQAELARVTGSLVDVDADGSITSNDQLLMNEILSGRLKP